MKVSGAAERLRRVERYRGMIVNTVPTGPGRALLKIEGELDFAGAPAVQAELARAADRQGLARMVIDLGAVTAADDKGVASLANAVRRAIVRHPALRVIAVARDISLAGALMHASVPVYGSRPAA